MQDLNNHYHSKAIHTCFITKNPFIPNAFLQIHTWLHLTRVIQSSIALRCLHFLKKNTDDPDLIPPSYRYVQPHLQTLRAYPLKKIRQIARPHCSHQRPEDPWRSFERFLDKNKRSSRWSSHLYLEHAFKEARPEPSSAHLKKHQRASRSPPKLWQGPELQTDSSKTRGSNVQPRWNSKTHKTVMISHHVLVRRRRGLALEEIVIHRRSHNKKTLLSLSSPRRTEGIPMCEAPAFEQTKPARHEWITVKSY